MSYINANNTTTLRFVIRFTDELGESRVEQCLDEASALLTEARFDSLKYRHYREKSFGYSLGETVTIGDHRLVIRGFDESIGFATFSGYPTLIPLTLLTQL